VPAVAVADAMMCLQFTAFGSTRHSDNGTARQVEKAG
jgi:hypothetical protein